MQSDSIFIKNGEQKKKILRPGRLYRMMIRSENMEAMIAELEPRRESRWYQHKGEELHLLLEGEIEYVVGEKSYNLSTGDVLWHKSTLKHKAKNNGDVTARYITIGTPPTLSLIHI